MTVWLYSYTGFLHAVFFCNRKLLQVNGWKHGVTWWRQKRQEALLVDIDGKIKEEVSKIDIVDIVDIPLL